MEAKLKLPEINQALRSAFSVLVWGAAAFWIRAAGFGFWPVLVFLVISAWLYFRPPLFIEKFAYSFLAVFLLVFITPYLGIWDWIVPVSAGTVFFLLLGVKNLVFLNRHSFHSLAHSLIVVWVALIFFSGDLGKFGLLILFVSLLFLIREYLVLRNSNEDLPSPLIKVAAVSTAFLASELAWGISLLPIGFIEETAVFAAMMFLAEDIMYYAINDSLDKGIAIRNSTLAIILVALVFSFSNWAPR